MAELYFDGTPNDTAVGYFTYIVDDDHWSWSDGMYELHGYEPYAVTPTTELVLHHKHPDDASRAFEVLETAVSNAQPFSCYHRIINLADEVRYVLSVGRGHLGSGAKVEQVTGFFVDLTNVVSPLERRTAEEAGDRTSPARQLRPDERQRDPARS